MTAKVSGLIRLTRSGCTQRSGIKVRTAHNPINAAASPGGIARTKQ